MTAMADDQKCVGLVQDRAHLVTQTLACDDFSHLAQYKGETRPDTSFMAGSEAGQWCIGSCQMTVSRHVANDHTDLQVFLYITIRGDVHLTKIIYPSRPIS
jgi:hypothetical protein